MTISLPDRLRADADRNTVSGDSGFSNEVMRDLLETAKLEREAAQELEQLQAAMPQPCCQEWDNCIQTCVPRLTRQLAAAKAEMRERCIENVTKDEIEEFRRDSLIRGPEPLPEWATTENRVLNTICDYALRSLPLESAAHASVVATEASVLQPEASWAHGAADPDVAELIERLTVWADMAAGISAYKETSWSALRQDMRESASTLQRQAEELAAANAKLEAAERRVTHLESVLINLRKMCDPNMSHQENLMSRKIDDALSKVKP